MYAILINKKRNTIFKLKWQKTDFQRRTVPACIPASFHRGFLFIFVDVFPSLAEREQGEREELKIITK
jgi:hypothetical protein